MINLNFNDINKIKNGKENDLFINNSNWDLIVIGAGPGGLNSGLYARRKGLNVGIIADKIGGQLNNTSSVENYLGFSFVGGEELSNIFYKHVKSLDIPLKDSRVKKIEKDLKNDNFKITLDNDTILISKTVIIATGGNPRKLNIKGEEEHRGKGVSYCAICDGPFFKDKKIAVAGGGNSAIEAAIDLSKIAKEVLIIHRSNFRADDLLLEEIKNNPKIKYLLNTEIKEIKGDKIINSLLLFDKETNKEYSIPIEGLFVEIGTIPNSNLVKDLVTLNNHNEIIVDNFQQTSLEGLYAVGDVTNQPFKQIIISAAEGAKAALAINNYLNKKRN